MNIQKNEPYGIDICDKIPLCHKMVAASGT